MFSIHPELEEDIEGIRLLLENTFGRPQEANLVDTLRSRGAITLSLVAFIDKQVVGYIAFTPVEIESDSTVKILGLAPLAILPAYQRQEIGSQLVETGLTECQRRGYQAIVVLGAPEFYNRFGFQQASSYQLYSAFDIPPEFFMVKELLSGSLVGHTGVVNYQPEFNEV